MKAEEATMSLAQRVRSVLDHKSIPPSRPHLLGYHIEERPDGTVRVHWGSGEPFVGYKLSAGGLEACIGALRDQRFAVTPDVLTDQTGFYILVREQPEATLTAVSSAARRPARSPRAP